MSENNKRKLHTIEDWNEHMISTQKLAHNILEFEVILTVHRR